MMGLIFPLYVAIHQGIPIIIDSDSGQTAWANKKHTTKIYVPQKFSQRKKPPKKLSWFIRLKYHDE